VFEAEWTAMNPSSWALDEELVRGLKTKSTQSHDLGQQGHLLWEDPTSSSGNLSEDETGVLRCLAKDMPNIGFGDNTKPDGHLIGRDPQRTN
jgi:hypothetical protein